MPVTLAMGSATALGKVDLTQALRAAHGKGWTKIAVPLTCFRNAGADMNVVALPMVLTSSGKLAVSLYSARVEMAAGQASCPAPQTSKASVKVKTSTKAKPHVKTKAHVKAKRHVKAKAHGMARKRRAR